MTDISFSHGAEVAKLLSMSERDLFSSATALRDRGCGRTISYSRKVFVPLTRLCRDVCHYCTYAQPPKKGVPVYLSPEDVLSIAQAGAVAGCKEALFTLGDKPELRYRAAREALAKLGYDSTIDYLRAMVELVHAETGLLAHVNPGVMTAGDIAKLRPVSASMGMMLESASSRLQEKGGCHFGSPDKAPALRLEVIAEAGRQNVPFTTGILIGIGETRQERIESLQAIRDLHDQYGHIQEIIIQNFRAKSGTRMANAPEPNVDDLRWTIAIARVMFGEDMNIQAPPNLTPDAAGQLIGAGLNDWGGISPVTPDYVNPEAAWPHLDTLAAETAKYGKILVERLTIYPRYLRQETGWIASHLRTAALRHADASGFVRTRDWFAGTKTPVPVPAYESGLAAGWEVERILDLHITGRVPTEEETTRLFGARAGEVAAVTATANSLRQDVNGDNVSYVVTRNINYTNVCNYRCTFCAFSKGKMTEELRGRPYNLSLDEVVRRAHEAWARGASEVCLQGGIHPSYTGDTYIGIVEALKSELPDLHIHAFSPLEVFQGAATLGISVGTLLERLKKAGLGSLPGTAAEILDDDVRAVICPDKINSAQWLNVMETAHAVGLRTTSTIMFGHVEEVQHWTKHILRLRALQERTRGFTEFVPLPFVHMETPMYMKGRSRRGPTWREVLLMHAVARLVFFPVLSNIQTSWPKLGLDGAAACLEAGANDLGGTLMNESISKAAGASHGQEMSPERMRQTIEGLNRQPRQRTTLYGNAPQHRVCASYVAQDLAPITI
ncbi:MAG: 5-amino-6-(D-ribitylamino)uracil--L-tyrosine 4-hydroxyphenyl transferase CofH [Rhodospirillales bacterium]